MKIYIVILITALCCNDLCVGAAGNLIYSKDQNGNTLLHIAAQGPYISMLDSLAHFPEINVNIQNQKGNTPLHEAILTKPHDQKMVFIIYLLTKKADLTIINNEGLTPVELAKQVDLKAYHCINACAHIV